MKAVMKAVLLAFAMGAIVIAATFVVSRALSVVFHDETFIKMKPTIVNALFCAILLISLKLGKPLPAIGFKRALHLTEMDWRRLTLHWALFFFLLAVFNEIVWRSQSTDFWLTWNVITFIPIIILFALSQVPLILPDVALGGRDGAALEEEYGGLLREGGGAPLRAGGYRFFQEWLQPRGGNSTDHRRLYLRRLRRHHQNKPRQLGS